MTDGGPEQRLVFGAAAEAYDAHRPTYAAELFDGIVDRLPPGGRAVDIGAGTGRVARALADRGIRDGVGVEPDEAMAAVFRRRLAGTGWTVQLSDFESCAVPSGSVDVITAGQAWHWVDRDAGLAKAAELLRPGGWLTLFWNRPVWDDADLRAALDAVYAEIAPDMRSSIASLGTPPKGEAPQSAPVIDNAPLDDSADLAAFDEIVEESCWHDVTYTPDSWIALLGTHSNHLLLDDDTRRRLHERVADTIRAHGETMLVRYRVDVWRARRT